jgi:hypothetical protein
MGSSEQDPYDVLGIEPTGSIDEVRRAYRAQAQINHPDRYMGASTDVRTAAERRMKQVNAAYDVLKVRLSSPGSSGPSKSDDPPHSQEREAKEQNREAAGREAREQAARDRQATRDREAQRSRRRAHRRETMTSLYANDLQLQGVLANLSDDEIEVAWSAIEQLDGVLEPEDRPLMAWAVVKPETGLLLACTSGLVFCPNAVTHDGEFWTRQSLLDYRVDDDTLSFVLEDESKAIITVRLVEDQLDLLVDVVQMITTNRSSKKLLRAFKSWLALP